MTNTNGVIIIKIVKNSNAARFGLAPGDIFKEINGQLVSSVSGLVRILKTPSKLWRITIDRGGKELSMAIKS